MKFVSDCQRLKNLFWYVGTPYSKYPLGLEKAFKHAAMLVADLLRKGIISYSPITHTHPTSKYGLIDPYDHEIWMPFDRKMMKLCDCMIVAKMDGWKELKGIAIEIEAFEDMGKRVLYLDVEGYDDSDRRMT